MGGYNNPLMAGVVDAIALGAEPGDIEVLSIGTGTVRLVPFDLALPTTPADLIAPRVRPRILENATRAAGCILDDPPDAATYTAHIVLQNSPSELGSAVRLNPVVQPVRRNGTWTYPDGLPKDLFDALVGLDMDATGDADVQRIRQLAAAWIGGDAENQPIRMRDDLSCALGDRTFAEAKSRWENL